VVHVSIDAMPYGDIPGANGSVDSTGDDTRSIAVELDGVKSAAMTLKSADDLPVAQRSQKNWRADAQGGVNCCVHRRGS
jgi:hypothetical protein